MGLYVPLRLQLVVILSRYIKLSIRAVVSVVPSGHRFLTLLLSFGAIGVLAFVSLLTILSNGQTERDIHTMRGELSDILRVVERLVLLGTTLPGHRGVELKYERDQKFRQFKNQLSRFLSSENTKNIKENFPDGLSNLEQFGADIAVVFESQTKTVEAHNRLNVLLTHWQEELGPGLLNIENMLADEGFRLQRNRQRLFIAVIILFFGALTAAAYLVLLTEDRHLRGRMARDAHSNSISDLTLAIKGLGAGIALFDFKGDLVFCNNRYSGIYGACSINIAAGINYDDLISCLRSEILVPTEENGNYSWHWSDLSSMISVM